MLTFIGFLALQSEYTAELTRLRDADQADRQFQDRPTPAQLETLRRNDPPRRERVLAILREADSLTGEDFDLAGLILQHGERPADFALGHFVAICANALGKPSSLVALTEDRFLVTIGRPQRFGSQFDGENRMRPTDDSGTAVVTDFLRSIYLQPSLGAYRAKGWRAGMDVAELIDTIVARRHLDRSPRTPFRGMRFTGFDPAGVATAFAAGRVTEDDQLRDAVEILVGSPAPRHRLLAHELATIAFIEDGRRPDLAQRTWSKLCRDLGQPNSAEPWRGMKSIEAVLAGRS